MVPLLRETRHVDSLHAVISKPKTLAEERLIEQKWLKTPFNAGVLFQLISI
jgi:hypothetical protein